MGKRAIQYLLCACILCCCCQILTAQSEYIKDSASTPKKEDYYIISQVQIEGLKRTKNNLVFRELAFKIGDTLSVSQIPHLFKLSENQLMNTTLFHEAVISYGSASGDKLGIIITVKERWYIFPLPYFKPIDRNLNQWIVEKGASFSRVNYGLKLQSNNTTGWNDKLRLWAIFGYTRQFSFSYDRLYLDQDMKWGMRVAMGFAQNKELNYNTEDDKQIFYKDENNFVKKQIDGSFELTYRKAIKTRHRFGIGYTQTSVADTVVKQNPEYFEGGRKNISFPSFYYRMNYNFVDYIPYPTQGYAAEINVLKQGIDKSQRLWELSVSGAGYWPLNKNAFISAKVHGVLKLPFKQPYYNRQILGYGSNFIPGYEYYVMDGVTGGYANVSFAHKVLGFSIKIPGTKYVVPKKIPFTIYARTFANAGYVYSTSNTANNRMVNRPLYSTGIGIDLISIYDFNLRLEWSFNHAAENNLYLHKKSVL